MSVIIRDIFDERGRLLVAKGVAATPELRRSLSLRQVVIKNYMVVVDDSLKGGSVLRDGGSADSVSGLPSLDLSLLGPACQDVVDAQDWISNHSYLRFHLTVLMQHMGWVYTHCLNVAILSVMMALRLGLERSQRMELAVGALLHDVGTIFIPPEILNKPGDLTTDERAIINNHAILGEKMLTRQGIPYRVACIAGQHHERWDGRGYPRQIKGVDIDLGAQIVAVADVFDALTSARPHRSAAKLIEAQQILQRGKDVDFNGSIVNLLFAPKGH